MHNQMTNTQTKQYIPKKPTKERLRNIAYFYLTRYSSSSENLRRVLKKRVYKAAKFHNIDIPKSDEWIGQIIEYFTKSGGLDDMRFARTKISYLSQKGKPPSVIKLYLLSKGVTKNIIEIVMSELSQSLDTLELSAAHQYARRRRIGPYRQSPLTHKIKQKELRKLAMAGYSYKIANQLVHSEIEKSVP